ncbi:MAG: 5'-methylthioadenosine/S-adenosylhomocysteine nucleosidase [Firmicutes bacterium]|nr:5'-methylthioadenosine/S-adenosylhomocysteine nucleosidase [candidate division NPL-UPA2 bacterium]MBT9154312.1 5'-methylthioadenosine/S-adenosylhomocysteine nucleosidase [candidate division NPL-UPA2 bacterium]MBT9155090.1 5'-methylthioadenosine/S-adenosylhomocysteine nucleosidase [candidate division NPL-UPA2 bacterium]
MTIGIVCAMQAELDVLRDALALREIGSGSPWDLYASRGESAIALISGVGKVSAAAGLSYLLSHYKVTKLVGIGVAGGIAEDLRIGDIVICRGAVQHDLDLTAFGYELGMVPGLRIKEFKADRALVAKAVTAAEEISLPVQIRQGLALTGDKFVAHGEGARLRQLYRGDCVDMETAAWAHVAHLFGVPWVAIRSISDQADGEAPANFKEFLGHAVGNMSQLVLRLLASM